MLQRLGEHIGVCLDRAKAAEARAADASDPKIKADYEAIAANWRTLANSFQFCESLERFLLDADRRRGERTDAAPSLPLLLTCPNCAKTMRIKTVDAADGHHRFTLICDQCNIEATRDS